jgi:hypothetical protein
MTKMMKLPSVTGEEALIGETVFVCPDCHIAFTLETLDDAHIDNVTFFYDSSLPEVEEALVPRRCYQGLSLEVLIGLWEEGTR